MKPPEVHEVVLPAGVVDSVDFWTGEGKFGTESGRTEWVGRRAGDGKPVLRIVSDAEPVPAEQRWKGGPVDGHRVVCDGNGRAHPMLPSCVNPRRAP